MPTRRDDFRDVVRDQLIGVTPRSTFGSTRAVVEPIAVPEKEKQDTIPTANVVRQELVQMLPVARPVLPLGSGSFTPQAPAIMFSPTTTNRMSISRPGPVLPQPVLQSQEAKPVVCAAASPPLLLHCQMARSVTPTPATPSQPVGFMSGSPLALPLDLRVRGMRSSGGTPGSTHSSLQQMPRTPTNRGFSSVSTSERVLGSLSPTTNRQVPDFRFTVVSPQLPSWQMTAPTSPLPVATPRPAAIPLVPSLVPPLRAFPNAITEVL